MTRRLFAVLFAVLFVLASPASAEHNTCHAFNDARNLPDAVNCDYDEPGLPIP